MIAEAQLSQGHAPHTDEPFRAHHFETAEPILKAMNSGTVYWNACDRVSAPVPWSGRKHSGIGSTLSHIGIRAFTQPKAYQMRGKYQ